jgi:hypothetical protein
MQVTRDELVEIIAYAVWRSSHLRPRRRDLDEARLWAAEIVRQLELCRIEWSRRPPPPPPATP